MPGGVAPGEDIYGLDPEQTRPLATIFAERHAREQALRSQGVTNFAADPQWAALTREMAASQRNRVRLGASFIAPAGGGFAQLLPRAEAAITKSVPAAARIAARLAPGAGARAIEKTGDIGMSETSSVLGQRMHDTLTKRLAAARTARRAATDADRKAFLAQTPTAGPIIKDYTAWLEDMASKGAADLSKEEKNLLKQSLAEMRGPRSLEAIEKERRRLNGLASGQWEGTSAVKQSFARQLADKLTAIMEQHNPAFASYLRNYHQLSEPINLYNKTLLGRAVTREGAGIPSTDIAALPGKFFHTRQSVETLRKLAGDDQFVDATARIHAASQLEARASGKPVAGAARQARAWLEKNKDWLNAVPDVRDAVERYADNLEKVAKTQRTAKVAAGAAAVALLLHEGARPYYWIRHLLGLP
jgi:hypothetical protein